MSSRGKWARDNCDGVTVVVRESRAEDDSVKLKNDGTFHLDTHGVFNVVKHGGKVNLKPERKPAFRSDFSRAAAGRTWSRGRACVLRFAYLCACMHVLCSPLLYCVKCTTDWMDAVALFGEQCPGRGAHSALGPAAVHVPWDPGERVTLSLGSTGDDKAILPSSSCETVYSALCQGVKL